jgi:CHASE2 domain-containing sensor protein
MLKRIKTTASKRKQRGQSTVEYIILVAAILAALIVFLKDGGVFQTAYNQALNQGTDGMEDMANRLASSRPTS